MDHTSSNNTSMQKTFDRIAQRAGQSVFSGSQTGSASRASAPGARRVAPRQPEQRDNRSIHSINSSVSVSRAVAVQPDVLPGDAILETWEESDRYHELLLAEAERERAARIEGARARAERVRAERVRAELLEEQMQQAARFEGARVRAARLEASKVPVETYVARLPENQSGVYIQNNFNNGTGQPNGSVVDSLIDQLMKLPIPSVRAWVTQFIVYCMFLASMYYAYSYMPTFFGSQAAVPSHVLPDVSHVCTGLMTRDLYDEGMQVCRGHPSTSLVRYCMLGVDVTTPAKKPEDLRNRYCVPSTLPLSPEHASKFIPRIKTCYKALVHGAEDIDSTVIDSVIEAMNGCMIGKLDAYIRDLNRDHGEARYATDPEVVTNESVVEATFKQVDEVAAEETGAYEQCVRETGDDIWNDHEIAYPKEREAYAEQVTKCMDQYPMKQRGVEVERRREETTEKARQQIDAIIESVERSSEVSPYAWMPSTTTMASTAVVGGAGALTYGVNRRNKVCLAVWTGAKAIGALATSAALTVYGWMGADNFARLILPMFRANVADWQTEIGVLRDRMMDPWAYWELVWVLKHRHAHRAPPPAANPAAEPSANPAAEPAANPAGDARADDRPDVDRNVLYEELKEYQNSLEQKAAHIKEVDEKAIVKALADEPIGNAADRMTTRNAVESEEKARARRVADDEIAAKRQRDRRQAEIERAEVEEKAAVQEKINAKHRIEVAEKLEIQKVAADEATKESKSKADANSERIAKHKASVQAENDRASRASSAAQVKPEVARAEVVPPPPPPPKSKPRVEPSDRVLRPRK